MAGFLAASLALVAVLRWRERKADAATASTARDL
jgi:Zn-dependent protease with chaperone function